MLTWFVVAVLAIGVYAQRLAGALLVDTARIPPRWRQVLDALPLAIISAVVALAAFSSDGDLVIDARLVGVAVAAVCAQRRLPMYITVIAAAVSTALVRLVV